LVAGVGVGHVVGVGVGVNVGSIWCDRPVAVGRGVGSTRPVCA
jgi:hypothetical protein